MDAFDWTRLKNRILRVLRPRNHDFSDEAVHDFLDEAVKHGDVSEGERDIAESALRLHQLTARDLMTPRVSWTCLNLDDPDETNWRKIVASGHGEFPVYKGSWDNIVGTVGVKALWANLALAGKVHLEDLMITPQYVHESQTATSLVETFRKSRRHLALVLDEFGHVQGLVTPLDILEALVGELPVRGQTHRPLITKEDENTWIADGLIDLDTLKKELQLEKLPDEDQGDFTTLNGYLLHHLGHIPETGEALISSGFHIEILSMERHRIAKVRIVRDDGRPLKEEEPATKDT